MKVNVVYLETSALLSWLFGEKDAKTIAHKMNRANKIISSVVTLVEAQRAFIRYESEGLLRESESRKLKAILLKASSAWLLMAMTREIENRAGERFPAEPVRTLDAIHLATSLKFAEAFPDLKILSLDKRIIDNTELLGIELA